MLQIIFLLSITVAFDGSAITPVSRDNDWWVQRFGHIQKVVDRAGHDAEVIFIGDSITQGWEAAGARVWQEQLAPLHALNLGIGGDRTEHVLWRLENGNVQGLSPKVAVVMIGTNNVGQTKPDTEEEVLAGVVAVIDKIKVKLPNTQVLLLDIFPRGKQFSSRRGSILQVNQALRSTYADVSSVTFLPIGHIFIETSGAIDQSIMPDYLHLTEEGYQRWADVIAPVIQMMLQAEVLTKPQS